MALKQGIGDGDTGERPKSRRNEREINMGVERGWSFIGMLNRLREAVNAVWSCRMRGRRGGRESWVECRDRYLQSFACAFHHKFTGHVIVGQNRISWIFFHAKDYYGSGHFRITPFQDLEKAIDAFQRTYHFTSGVFVLTGSSPTHFGHLPIPTHQPALPIIWWLPTREVVAWLCSG